MRKALEIRPIVGRYYLVIHPSFDHMIRAKCLADISLPQRIQDASGKRKPYKGIFRMVACLSGTQFQCNPKHVQCEVKKVKVKS